MTPRLGTSTSLTHNFTVHKIAMRGVGTHAVVSRVHAIVFILHMLLMAPTRRAHDRIWNFLYQIIAQSFSLINFTRGAV